MKVEVEVISKEIIRPSSPTPDHHFTYQLSFLNQISPPVYNPILKISLSDVLTQFYPLAGRAQGNLFIDSNDQGIPYLETRVKCQLSDVIENPIPIVLNKFIPFQVDEVTDISLGVQLNIFEPGGIALGLCISHKISDALSQQGDLNHIVRPQFVSAKLFPPKNISGFNPRVGITKDNVVTKMFVFEDSKIEALKSKYSVGDHNTSLENHQKPPSRVEALSTFIWSRFVAATQVKSGIAPKRLYSIVHAVNLRTMIDPPFLEHSFGNICRIAMTIPFLDIEEGCYGIVKQVRDQVKRVDKNYIGKLQEGKLVTLSFTSLCRFPLYEADFGGGNPTWVGSPALTFNNLVVFMDAKSGGGIEAYVNMKEKDLAKIEGDGEFLAFVSPYVLK
ncbi:unnamed protein product [Malus baccata var. baccata]